MKYLFLNLFIFVSSILTAQNQLDLAYHLPQNVTYNPNIPTPESIIGHAVGEWHITHDKLVSYMMALSKASNRITIENRGNTFEGRPLILLTITTPENQKNIENIRLNHLKLMDADSETLNIEAMPLVVYQGFSIHGNEASGCNASLLLAYYLAAAQGSEIDNLLKNTVVLLDPALNPDGIQRFASWVNMNKSDHQNGDSNDIEYNEIWPKARTNHYWFDLNRDWLPAQLPESKARIASYHKWMPNILTDHHEMATNATFFFQPGIQSRVHPLTPKANQELTKEIGNYHAKALNAIGSLYFTEERYDDYYYGKGSTFPDINGAIGILFKQASSRGHLQESDNGLLTFPFTIRNQFKTTLSTLEAGQDMRIKLLNYQKDFYQNERNENLKNSTKAIVFGDEHDAARTYHLAEILKQHQIGINKLHADVTVNGKLFKKENSYIIPTNQTKSTIIKAIFEKRTTFTDSLFYDISAWTYPLAFNLDYAELKSTSNVGESVSNLDLKQGSVSMKSNYAYLMPWHAYYAPKALHKMHEKGLRVKVGMEPFSINNENFDYGTILISVQNQMLTENELYTFLKDVAKDSHVEIVGVNTGLTEGIDLGSAQFKIIKNPKVVLLVGDGITSYDAGEIWHLFDQRFEMPLTKLDISKLATANISKYTTLIMPSTSMEMDSKTLGKLKAWVKAGGTLIGFRNAVKWLSKNDFMKLDYAEAKVMSKNGTFRDKDNFKDAQGIEGAIFETELDRTHPINFGYSNHKLPMFRDTKIMIKADSASYNNPIKYTKNPLLSGYISKPNLDVLKGTVPFQTVRSGSGRVIAFTDNNNFRAFWFGTNKLLMNAVFFADMM